MYALAEELSRIATAAVRGRYEGLGEVGFARSGRPDLGDLQSSSAMQLAKAAKTKPRDLALLIASALEGHAAVANARIDGPGFVNVFVKDEWLAAHAHDGLTLPDLGRGRTVVIDYSSPNVAKPMHIGHIRSTILGDAIKRALLATGWKTIGDNHLGDWGTQFGKLIVAWQKWLDQDAFARAPVEELLRLYIKFQEEEKRQGARANEPAPDATDGDEEIGQDAPPILKEAREALVKLQKGDPDSHALWKKFVDVSMAEFDRVYRRLGVTFDVTLGESFYHDRLAATVETLRARGLAEESRGALVVFFKKPDGTDELPPFIVRKADGGFNYATTDVAALVYRVETWHPARIVIITDERQQLHFRQLFNVARRLGITEPSLEHVWFGLMRLPEGTISTREGKLISLEQLLDEAERRALEVARAHSEGLGEAELREVARVVGLGAVKYNDLSKDRTTLVTFSWDKALSLSGNTAPYLQYAYARIRSLLRKADEAGAPAGTVTSLLPAERALVTRVGWFPDAVDQVGRARPHLLCDYLFDLANAFSSFYTELPVLKAEPDVRASRLALCRIVGETLQRGLGILGIEVLERM